MVTRTSPEFGVIQGRLIQSPPGQLQWFPQDHWESEFFLASAVGFRYIELIAERQHNAENPIWSDDGITRIKELCARNGLYLPALCNDFVIDHCLAKDRGAMAQALDLIARGQRLGIDRLVLPLFEASELTVDGFEDYKGVLREVASAAREHDMVVCLETALNGPEFLDLCELLDHGNISCVFDSGNNIAAGHDIYGDIVTLGDRIVHFHVKDKDAGNRNVLLGTGLVNFFRVFESLAAIGYDGPYTFETDRGRNPTRTAVYNRTFIEYFISESA